MSIGVAQFYCAQVSHNFEVWDTLGGNFNFIEHRCRARAGMRQLWGEVWPYYFAFDCGRGSSNGIGSNLTFSQCLCEANCLPEKEHTPLKKINNVRTLGKGYAHDRFQINLFSRAALIASALE